MDPAFFLINFAYHLALAVIVGGGLVLAVSAPAVFRALPGRGQAGTAFGAVIAQYDALAIVSVLVVLVAGYLRSSGYETTDEIHWIRWAALLLMSAGTLYASAYANSVARQFRKQTPDYDDLPDGAPARVEFARLHAGSRRAMSFAIVAGLVAMLLTR